MNKKFGICVSIGIGLGGSVELALSQDSSDRATPGASQTALPQLGDYIELDAAIKNEMYGTIDFPDAPLKDIVRAISKLANKNFILDRKIENRRITIISPASVTKQEAYNAFLSALYMNDLTVVTMGSFLKIIEAKSALQSNIRVFVGDYAPPSEEIITLIYPLKYLNAEDIQRFLVDLVPRNGRITSYPNTNSLVMTDTGLNLRRIIAILKSVDVPGHEDQLESIAIRFANAKGIATLVTDILEAQAGGRNRTGANRNNVQRTRGGGIITRIVPDERTNSLVVLANGRGVQELKSLISKLDTPDAAGGGNIHIYYCKNAVAEDLAGTINSLLTTQRQAAGTRPGATPGAPDSPVVQPANPGNNRGGASADTGGIRFEGNIRVTADKATNSLIVLASGSDFAALRNVLQRLDIPRRQVYVEAAILEIRVSEGFEFGAGVNLAAPGLAQAGGFIPSSTFGGQTFANLVSTPAGLSGIVAGFTAGQKYTIQSGPLKGVKINSVTGLIRALQASQQAQILHQPQILTSDNQEAEIKITEKIPTASDTTTATSTGPVTTTNIQKEEVSIGLKLTPQLGEGNDLVRLKVDQSIDDFTPSTRSPKTQGQIEITQRKATTNVVVRNGDTVVVGGLQKTTLSDVRGKFPLLGDLPVIGFLFRSTEKTEARSNLALFLTPHIINEYNDLLKITDRTLGDREKLSSTLDPKDSNLEEVRRLRSLNRENMKKAPPRGWGFKPMIEEDAEDNEGATATENPGSAFLQPPRESIEVQAPAALASSDTLSPEENSEIKEDEETQTPQAR